MSNYELAKFTLVSITLPAFRCVECGTLTASTLHRCGNPKYDIVQEDELDGK